jgi:hypothetical protein
MDDLATLSMNELANALREAESDLEDVEEMRLFTLGQTGVHLGAGRMKSLQATWDRDEARLHQRIEAIKSLLHRAAQTRGLGVAAAPDEYS